MTLTKQIIGVITASLIAVSAMPVLVLAADLGATCEQVSSTGNCPNMSVTECKALLQQCSDYYDQQAQQISADLSKTAAQKNTLANQVSSLKKRIQGLEYQISQGNVKIKGLSIQISDTQSSINKAEVQIDDSRVQLGEILRTINQEDRKSLIGILLEGNLSDFFGNLVYLETLNAKVGNLLDSTRDLQAYLTEQKAKMDSEVDDLQKTIAIQQVQKSQNESNRKEQEQYLQLTEAQYQQQLAEKQDVDQKASAIKALLFQIVGVSKVPTFGEALEMAKVAAASVGIRPAFLLAIISQESAIGRNVGQCVLTDPDTGVGKRISTGATVIHIMKPSRDVPPFLEITSKLGRDPYDTPVSCWIPAYVSGQPYGWGGAMGPAQFIASTWASISGRLTNILGHYPDPWSIPDSFTASGLYLSDLGASKQTTSAENTAAARYYGQAGAYNSQVLQRAACIQSFIDTNTMSAGCQRMIF